MSAGDLETGHGVVILNLDILPFQPVQRDKRIRFFIQFADMDRGGLFQQRSYQQQGRKELGGFAVHHHFPAVDRASHRKRTQTVGRFDFRPHGIQSFQQRPHFPGTQRIIAVETDFEIAESGHGGEKAKTGAGILHVDHAGRLQQMSARAGNAPDRIVTAFDPGAED